MNKKEYAKLKSNPERYTEYRRKKSETDRKYRDANREKVKEQNKKWAIANPEKMKMYSRKYRESNPEKEIERDRKYRINNREKEIERHRRWDKANPKSATKRKLRWLKNHPGYPQEYRDANRERVRERMYEYRRANAERYAQHSRNRRAHLSNIEGSHTLIQWQNLKSYYMDQCLCCGIVPDNLTADHIVPIVKGGSNYISNIQPLCISCNSKKGTKIIDYR
jgi:5-methylcytosine-specific restriction endonuclease McrA